VGQNLKFECNLLASCIGTQILSAPIFDTQIAAFLLDENRTERAAEFKYGIYTLKQLAYDYCNFDGYDQGVLAQRSTGSLFDMELKKLSSYGAMDVYITLRLANALIEEAERQNYREELFRLMFHFYTPIIRLFSDAEQNGFYVNREYLRHLISADSPLIKEREKIEQTVKDSIAGQKANAMILNKKHPGRIMPLGGSMPWVFEFSKGGHAQALFFDVLRLPLGKAGASGVPSVDKAWQNENKSNEYVAMFSEWQGLRILYNTFAKKLYSKVDPRGDFEDCKTDNRIRPNFKLSGPVTGRLACSDPNLQQIPRGDNPAKKAIKNIFQATEGHILVQLDYKANEIRWVGILSKDEGLTHAINEGYRLFADYKKNPTPEGLEHAVTFGDIHKQTASMIFDKEVGDVTKNERQAAKACLAAGTLTPTKTGFKPIEDIEVGEEVWTGEKWTPVLELYRKKAKVVRLTTKRGWSIDVSEDHKLEVYDRRDLSTSYLCVRDLDPEHHYIPLRRQDSFDFDDVELNFVPDEGVSEDIKLECPYCENFYHNLYTHLDKIHGISKEQALVQGIDKFKSDWSVRKSASTISRKFKPPCRYPAQMTETLAWWLGCLIAEGSCNGSSLEFTQLNNDYWQDYLNVHLELFGVVPTTSVDKRTLVCKAGSSVYVKQFALYLGYRHADKEVPWSILHSSKKCQAAFIRGFMSGDGSCPSTKVRTVKATSSSETLIKQLSVLLWNFGIVNTVGSGRHKLPVKKIWKTYYHFTATGEAFDRYFETIGESHNISYRPNQGKRHPNDDNLPGLLNYLKKTKKEHKQKYEIHSNAHVLKELSWDQIEIYKEKYQQKLKEGGYNSTAELLDKWEGDNKPFLAKVETVVDLEGREDEEVYDVCIDPIFPNFIANAARQEDCVFGILYGSSVRAIAEAQIKSVEEVQEWFDSFYRRFPKIAEWKKGMEEKAKRLGYVETPNGRRRRFPIFDMYRNERGYFNPDDPRIGGDAQGKIAECLRQSVNAPIQGVASDAGMIGAALFADYVREHNKPWVLSNAVHDSCVYLVPYDELEDSLNTAEDLFTDGVMGYMTKNFGINFNLPLEVDFELGLRWGELEAWDYSPNHLVELLHKFKAERGEV